MFAGRSGYAEFWFPSVTVPLALVSVPVTLVAGASPLLMRPTLSAIVSPGSTTPLLLPPGAASLAVTFALRATVGAIVPLETTSAKS